jgi:hypothetical protein
MPSPQPRSVDHSSLRRGEVLPRWQSFADFLHSLGEHYKKAQSPQTPASSESYGLLISRAFKRELTAPRPMPAMTMATLPVLPSVNSAKIL